VEARWYRRRDGAALHGAGRRRLGIELHGDGGRWGWRCRTRGKGGSAARPWRTRSARGGEKEKRARVGGLAGAATRWKGGRRSDRGPECATGGRGAVPATGKTGERTGGSGTGEKLGPAAGPVVLGQPNVFALIRLKDDPPILKNFQVKYGSVGNYIRNNFAYGNFLKFRIEFELKIREGSSC
jgi:hypothetical protein